MRVKVWLSLLVFSVVWSCQEPDGPTVCAVEDPIKELPWIQEELKEIENSGLPGYFYLVQANYKGDFVFFRGSCCPFCKFAIVIKDCQGNVLNNISFDQITDQKIIWKPANSFCKLD
jgi:hypothetical protein